MKLETLLKSEKDKKFFKKLITNYHVYSLSLFKNLAFPRGIKIKSKSFTRFDLSARVSSDFSSSSSQHSQESSSTDGVVKTNNNNTPKPAYLGVDKLREIEKNKENTKILAFL